VHYAESSPEVINEFSLIFNSSSGGGDGQPLWVVRRSAEETDCIRRAGRDSSGVCEASAASGGVRRGLKHSAVNVHNVNSCVEGGIGLIDNYLRLIDNKQYCFRNNYLSVDLPPKKQGTQSVSCSLGQVLVLKLIVGSIDKVIGLIDNLN
jgi:hypothetical protein